MKKIVLSIVVLFVLLGFTGCINKTQEYSNARWEKGFSSSYSDDMRTKYPDIEKLAKTEQNKAMENYNNGIIPAKNHVFKLKRNEDGFLGVYESDTNKLIIPHKYRYLEPCKDFEYFMFFNAKNYDNTKILDYKNNVLFESNYDEVDCKTCWCGIKTKNNGKYGMVSYSGIEVLKPEFDEIECQKHWGESGGYYYIARKGNLYGVWNNQGKEIIPLQKKKLSRSDRSHHFFEYEDKGTTGIMDIYGNLMTHAQYNDIMHQQMTRQNKPFKSDKTKNNHIIDKSKNNIFKKYGKENVHQIAADHYAIGQPQQGMFIVNQNGKRTTKKSYPSIYQLSEKHAIFMTFSTDDPTVGVIDFNGNVIMEAPSKEISYIRAASDNGLVMFDKGDQKGIYYKSEMITPPEYEKIYFTKGHVLIRFYKGEERYYYIASFEDFAKNKGDLSKCAQYKTNTYKTLNKNCFKVNTETGEEKVYCAKDE